MIDQQRPVLQSARHLHGHNGRSMNDKAIHLVTLTGLLTTESSISSVRPLSFSSSENSCDKVLMRGTLHESQRIIHDCTIVMIHPMPCLSLPLAVYSPDYLEPVHAKVESLKTR